MTNDIFSVEGKVCLVTGASSGLGAHFAQVLTARGARVMGASRTDVESGQPGSLQHVRCDVTSDEDVEAAFDAAEAAFGPVDVLVNNAGEVVFGRAEDVSEADLAYLFDVNVTGTARMTRAAVRRMRRDRRGGAIIHVTSALAGRSLAGLSSYGASKAAVEHMTRSQSSEWARHGIRVNAIAPGWFPTGMTEPYLDKGYGPALKTRIPMRRLGEASELDGALLLLASDASRYMTGSTITVDGGFTAAG